MSDLRNHLVNELNKKVALLQAGDIDRLVKFAEAMIVQKKGKRSARAKSRERPIVSINPLD